MQHLKFTYVDAITGAPITVAPAANGPAFPAVAGLEFGWARESAYPTNVPEFFGTCPDDSSTDVPGVLGVHLQADWEQMRAAEAVAMDAKRRNVAKAARQRAVDAITVTTAAGNTFDGDEVSQNRMARAIIALQATDTPTTTWVLADNSAVAVPAAELSEALALAGAAQSAVWVLD